MSLAVLPKAQRLTRSAEFAATVRRGARSGGATLVVHLVVEPTQRAGSPVPAHARAGFVVSRSVGGSVVRHAVTRRLRALMAARLGSLPAGSSVVVRALPDAAHAPSARLAADLDRALAGVVGKVVTGPSAAGGVPA